MYKFLAVFSVIRADYMQTFANVELELDAPHPSIETIRDMEAKMLATVDARHAAMINLIPLVSEWS